MAVLQIPADLKGMTFGVQNSFTDTTVAGSWVQIQAEDINFEPAIDMIPVQTQKPQSDRGPEPMIVGAYGGKLSLKIKMRGGNGAESEFSKIARYFGCTRTNFAGTTGGLIDSATPNSLTGATINIGNITVGDCVCAYKTGATPQVRWVSGVDDTAPNTTLTVEPNFASTPADDSDLLAIDTFKPTTAEAANYLAIRVYAGDGGSNVHMWTLYSCVGTWKFSTMEAGKLPYVEFEFSCNAWVDSGATATTHTADTYGSAYPVLASSLYIDNTATKTKDFAFDPGLSVDPLVSTEGTQGRSGWFAGAKSPKLDFTPYHNVDHITAWTAGTILQVGFESVKDTNEFWAIFVPRVQIVGVKHQDLGNKLLSTKPTLHVCDALTGTDEAITVKIPTYMIAVSSV